MLHEVEKTPFTFKNILRNTKSDETHLNYNSKPYFKTPSLLLKQKSGFHATPSRPTKKPESGRTLLSLKKPVISKLKDSSKMEHPKAAIMEHLKRSYISSLGNLNRCASNLSIL